MKILTIGKIISRIAIIIAVVELFIMPILANIPHEMHSGKLLFTNIAFVSFLNAVFLVTFASPLIYFWVIKPFVDARDSALAKVTHMAHYDPLTHLANRRLINHNMERLLSQCVRRETFSALFLIDLDKFKLINDNYGHDAGDAVLVEVAKRLKTMFRNEDIVGRIGGDEFVILIDQLDREEKISNEKVNVIAEKLNQVVKAPFKYKQDTFEVGTSIGISLFCTKKISIEAIFKRADTAMYQAKNKSTQHEIYSE